MFVYKPVKSTPLNKKHIAHKSWTITDETANTIGVVSYSGHYSRGEWSVSDTNCANVALEPTTTNNYYRREIFDSIYHLYYTDVENSTKSGDAEYLLQQTRDINSSIHVLSIPSNIFGHRIKENSFTMSNANHVVYDDGVGNLRDSRLSLVTPAFYSFKKSDYIIKCDFNDGWKLQKGNLATDSTFYTRDARLQDISDGPFTPVGKNITFGRYTSSADLYGVSGSTFCTLHGSQTINSESNSFVQIENSLTLGANRRSWDDPFTISLWVKAPISQSVRQSFTGEWSPALTSVGQNSQRSLKDHGHNVITTSRQWSSSVPWELSIYNSTHADKGKIFLSRGHGGSETIVTSSVALNDGQWHHVAIVKKHASSTIGNITLWIDGVYTDNSILDPVFNETMHDDSTDIFIGARPWGYKTRENVGTHVRDIMDSLSGQTPNPPVTYKNITKNYIYPFKGSVDQYRIFNRALNAGEISSLHHWKRDSDIVGNIFYNHGIAVITDLSASYKGLIDDYTLKFKGTTEHTIHNYQCVVEDEEYNVTFNPSARVNNDTNNQKLKGFATSSEFTPFITTIGLYNQANELLAISKLANPIKSPTDLDIVFNVQFDT